MGPAEGELNLAFLGQGAVAAIAVDLQHALEPGEVFDRPFARTVGGVDIDRRWWIASTPGPVISGIGPQLSGLGLTSPGIEHRQAGLVGEQLG